MSKKQHIRNLGHLVGANGDLRVVNCSILVKGAWKVVQGLLGHTENGDISLIVGEGEKTKEYDGGTRVGFVHPVH